MRTTFLLILFSISAFSQSPGDHEAVYPTVTNFADDEQIEQDLTIQLLLDSPASQLADLTPRQQANEWLQYGESPLHVAIDAAFLDFLKKNPDRLKEFGQDTVDAFVDQYFYSAEQGGGLRAVPTDGDPFGPKFASGTTRQQVEMYYARSLRYFLTVKDLEGAAKKGIDKAKEMGKALQNSGLAPFLKAVLMPTIPNMLISGGTAVMSSQISK